MKPIEVIEQAAVAEKAGFKNWIGTMGVGRFSIAARPVKTQKQAEAWCRKMAAGSPPNTQWVVFQENDYLGKAIGWGACAR